MMNAPMLNCVLHRFDEERLVLDKVRNLRVLLERPMMRWLPFLDELLLD